MNFAQYVRDELDRLGAELISSDTLTTKEFGELTDRIKKLLEIELMTNKVNETNVGLRPEKSKLEKILNNAPVINGLFGVGGVLLMMNHERLNIFTSKALSHVRFK